MSSPGSCNSPILQTVDALQELTVPIPVRSLQYTHPNSRYQYITHTQNTYILLTNCNLGLYTVIDGKGQFGVPGGRKEQGDRSIWDTIRRHFSKDIGIDMPRGRYSQFEWGDYRHSTRVYHRIVSNADALSLPIGLRGNIEIVWLSANEHNIFKFNKDLQTALRIYDVI
jgi:hypothetical protein